MRWRPNITSVFALFIGMFIIYNTFAIAVTQRRAEIGILRALGATRGQIRTLFLTESAITGLVGTLAGVAFGIAMARAMAGYIGGLLEEVYGIAQSGGADRNRAVADRRGGRDGSGYEPDRRRDSGARGGVRGSGERLCKRAVISRLARAKPGRGGVGRWFARRCPRLRWR